MSRFLTLATVLLGVCGLAGAAVGAGLASGTETPLMAIFTAPNAGAAEDAAQVADFAEAVRRWTAEAPDTGPGEPLTGKATTLLAPTGTPDTLRAFPTSKGRVCFEVLGAGTCGELGPSSPIAMGILYTKDAGTRVFGIASDDVTRVQIDLAGDLRDATLRRNGFHYRLSESVTSNDIRRVISTTSDGQRHVLAVHP